MWTTENIPDQQGKVALVTGANTGIGFETARALYQAGAHVILACRNETNAQQAFDELRQAGGRGTLEIALLNLASLDSIRAFAQAIVSNHSQLHLLINNAGIMTPPASRTADGFELQFGVNFLGHFALTGYLYPLLAQTPESRIVTLTSLAYRQGAINFDNLRLEKPYDAQREYAQSKLADLIFSQELSRRMAAADNSILSVAAHPGVTKTDLSRYMNPETYQAALDRLGPLMETAQGALPSLYAATSFTVQPGGFYGPDRDGGLRGYPAPATIQANALDEAVGQKLWQVAEEITGIKYPSR